MPSGATDTEEKPAHLLHKFIGGVLKELDKALMLLYLEEKRAYAEIAEIIASAKQIRLPK